jgi:2-C-methyl-D-erythritol 4-phosphate cytidylyltransferase/2-C-methyl-D-erythritol 2,4-cyclodiphosphate synthase
VVFVVPPDFSQEIRSQPRPACLSPLIGWSVVAGGSQRQDSVLKGLSALSDACSVVAVHDAARPFPRLDLTAMVERAHADGCCVVPAVPVRDSLRRADENGWIIQPVDRTRLHAVQTPQVAPKVLLQGALTKLMETGQSVTDEAEAMILAGHRALLVPGAESNFKVTLPGDLDRAEKELLIMNRNDAQPAEIRIGTGHDIHRLVPGRPLILGTVTIPHTHGLSGHSDADVVLHAITDALLSSVGLGDIGTLFPDTDPQWKGADSRIFVERARELVTERGWRVSNLSVIILAEAPKLKPYMDLMRGAIADLLRLPMDAVGLSAGTMEGMGPVGRREAIEAQATVLVVRRAI